MTKKTFKTTQQEKDGAIIIKLAGDLDLAAAPEFRSGLEDVVNRPDVTLVLDVEDLTYIDSTGIGIIVSVVKVRDELNAPFIVRNIPAGIRRLFDMTGISRFLNEGEAKQA